MDKKLNILYDATILNNWSAKNAGRSGIYFVAFNLLKEFIKSENANVTLYYSRYYRKSTRKFLAQYFPNQNIEIFGEDFSKSKLYKIYHITKIKKRQAKKYKHNLKKILLQIKLLFVSFVYKLAGKLYKLNKKKDLKKIDCFFSPVFKLPKNIKREKSFKKYTVLYDVIPLKFKEYHPDSGKNSWFIQLVETLNKNDYYFAISDQTKKDFIESCPQIDPNKIYTTLLACDEKFKPVTDIAKTREKYNIPGKYVFSLCTLEPRKNLIRAVKTFIEFIKKNNINDMYFVLGGGHWDTFIDILSQNIDDLNEYKDKIIKAGYIDDEDLPALYSGAQWFVYTSMYEGFGLPPLEAMACGCPVITSNNSSLPEVVSDAGITIDWDSDEQHIAAYEKYYFNPELKNEFAQKGLEHSKQFSWEKCAKTMIEIMQNNMD